MHLPRHTGSHFISFLKSNEKLQKHKQKLPLANAKMSIDSGVHPFNQILSIVSRFVKNFSHKTKRKTLVIFISAQHSFDLI